MIKAVIFDFDGLIVDTESAWYEAFKDVFRQYGVDLPLPLWARCIGTTFEAFDPFAYLEEQLQRKIDKEAVDQKTKERHDFLMASRGLRPGVRQYLEAAKRQHLGIGLASSSSRSWVEPYLKQYGIIQYFDAILTADHVKKVKPDPELYLKALSSLNVKGEEAVAFEDSLNGLRAAKAAGLYCVVVPNQVTDFMPFENHDLKLGSMEELPLEQVIAAITCKAGDT